MISPRGSRPRPFSSSTTSTTTFLMFVLVFLVCCMMYGFTWFLWQGESHEEHLHTPDLYVDEPGLTNVLPLVYREERRSPTAVKNLAGLTILKADYDGKVIQEHDVTILIKTMDRPRCIRELVISIREQHPSITIMIADDGQESCGSAVSDITDLLFFRMPYDSGLSSGRNLMISQVLTKYILMLDDDFKWDKRLLESFMEIMQIHPYLDLVGGRAGLDFAGLMRVINDTLYLVKGNNGILEGTSPFSTIAPTQGAAELPPTLPTPCVLVDFMPNFYLARTESLLKLQWDNNLKVGEHEEFFIRFNNGKFKAAYCTSLYIQNQQNACDESSNTTKARKFNRARARAFIKKGLYSHNISKLANCLGREFFSVTWNPIVPSPFSENCYETPLPEPCPQGRMGMKCDQCAPGFTGANCDTCLPNHFGHQCVPCLCEHGTCVVSEDGDDHIVHCKCEAEWYGPTCKAHLLLGPNLITDSTFASLQTPGSGPWYVFKDGCIKLEDNGVWMTNDGFLSCGAAYGVNLNQEQPAEVVISVESRGVDVATLRDPAAYSVYLDFAFQNGEYMFGQVISFPDGTHGMQFKELIIKDMRAIKQVSLYIMFQMTSGKVFFQNVSVRQRL